jgi:murein DD-endopeptidase MepM/ murein hydrolase activator NlpD
VEPLARCAAVVAALSALTRAVELASPTPQASDAPALARSAGSELASVCPPGTLPDARVCIPVPEGQVGGEELEARAGGHHDRSGRWRSYEQIPRRPERPTDYRRYVLPIPTVPGQSFLLSGYDLDQPDEAQRRGAHLSAVGHGGVDIAQKRGTEVRLVALEHQVGDAEVLHVGTLFGNSVVTRHSLREGNKLREYLVIHGHLEGPAPGLARGATVREGSLIGFVGDSGSPGDVHLHLEMRRVREGVDAGKLAPGQLTQSARTVACDPRNVLRLADAK